MTRPSPAFCNPTDNSTTLEELPALYRSNEHVHLFVTGDAIRLKDASGKNFQFFRTDNKMPTQRREASVQQDSSESGVTGQSRKGNNSSGVSSSSVFMEYWPMGPRTIHDLGDSISKVYSKEVEFGRKKRVVDLGKQSEVQSEVAPNPKSAVAMSLDSSLRAFIKRDRSSV